jgi:hypothetical protein
MPLKVHRFFMYVLPYAGLLHAIAITVLTPLNALSRENALNVAITLPL